jgi:hypothetical protein
MTSTTPVTTWPPTGGAGRERRDRRPVWAGAGLGLLTFLGYLPGLGRSLDFDSAQTLGMFIKPGPPWAAFRLQAAFNNHPMFSFFEQLVRVGTGRTDPATMRVLPILFGALAVAVLTWFTARRHGLVAGVVAGGLLAANPTFASLSRGVRGYSLLVLCAIVATVLVAEDRPDGPRWADVAYILAAGIGLATHLYMFPVLVAHLGAVVARRRLDSRWRIRFAGAGALAAVAYAGMSASMLDTMGRFGRVLQPGLPWRVAVMAAGGDRAALVVAPLVVVGAVLLLRRSRAARGATLALAGVLLLQWVGLQSTAMTPRFFVWLVPGSAYLAGVAVGRFRLGAVLGAGSALLALLVVVPGLHDDPTAYRQAAALVRSANSAGARSCVVDIGVRPMQAYLDSPRDFAAIVEPGELDQCDVVVVAAWWQSTADWYKADERVIAEAERRYPYRLVLGQGDPALVFANRPLPEGAPASRPA